MTRPRHRSGRAANSLAWIVAGAFLGTVAFSSSAFAGYASIVIDESDGQVLNEVNADQINHPASLTKMMTLYLAFEAIGHNRLRWDQMLPVSAHAANKSPTKLGLRPGSGIAVRDCVLGMIVLSANDAATVVAEALGGSEQGFARMMTDKARALGMSSSQFVNASGLPDEDQITTARDLGKLAMALYHDFPNNYALFATRQFVFAGRTIVGHNHLMYRFPGMDGLKTGYTAASGFNLASSAVRDGHRLFGIVLGGQSPVARDNLMATLLENGFAHRPTEPVLVAEAAGESASTAHRILASMEHAASAFSPLDAAEAATAPPAHHNAAATGAHRWAVASHPAAAKPIVRAVAHHGAPPRDHVSETREACPSAHRGHLRDCAPPVQARAGHSLGTL